MTDQQTIAGGAAEGAKVLTFLTREQILAADDVRYEVVDTPEWGGPVRIRTLTGDQAARFQDMKTDEERAEVMPLILSLAIVNAAGDRIFGPEDLAAIARKSMQPLTRILKVVNRMNGFEKEGEAALGNASSAAKPGATPSA